VSSDFQVGGVAFGTQGLEFTYTASNSTFALAGTADVNIGGIDDLSITFGHGTKPGLVITGGQLTQLDTTVNSNIQVSTVTFGTQGLEFTWTSSGNTFTLAGTAAVTVGGIGDLSATFGHGSNPGLVITSGQLTSLDMTVSSNFQVGAVTFT